ncbi:MAG: hypothetical protein EKK47_16470 [Burkholderiales bacterium]|nr:MAG: hypothetical protein EKK47_16470 [Burkholderiales bacterium]
MSRNRWALPVLLAMTSAVGAAVHLHEGQLFTSARKSLIKDKWVPVPMHTNDHYVYEGVEKQLVKRGFKEVDSCSMDSSRCILYYKRGRECLRLDTVGEQVVGMKVEQWSSECPDAPPRKSE